MGKSPEAKDNTKRERATANELADGITGKQAENLLESRDEHTAV